MLVLKSVISYVQTRDVPDYRLRGGHNTYNRGGRGGSDRYAGRSGSAHLNSTGIDMISWIHKDLYEPLLARFSSGCSL